MLRRLFCSLRAWWALQDSDERIDGSGEAFLNPAYNGRNDADREIERARPLDDDDADPPRQ